MSWIGGKKSLRELIVTLFPLYYERYIEVFGRGGWVLFHKQPGNDFEVYNDFNGLLVNLYRCVREKPQELMAALAYCLNSRVDFELVKNALARDSPASDVQRAAWFYQLIRYSYASGLTSYGSQPHDIRSNFPLIEQAHRRLAKVVIENKDFEKLIGQYDRPVSFFYCDPPYFETESYYKNVGEDASRKKTISVCGMRSCGSTANFCCPTTTVSLSAASMIRRAFRRKPLPASTISSSGTTMVRSSLKFSLPTTIFMSVRKTLRHS